MPSVDLIQYKETLTRDEMDFLRKQEQKDRKVLFHAARVFLIICFICPFVVSWLRAMMGAEEPFSYMYYFLSVLFLMFFCGIGLYWSYRQHLWKIRRDLRSGTKTVERAYITRKQYMASANSFHFYLNSAVKISIEVSEEDFRKWEEGDMIHIAYSTYARQYFGYF